MSSDGAMDKPRSARPARGDDRGMASIALGVLLILALIATVVMIFSDNPVWMRIGTLAALWAAFIGAFLVARYRRQAASEASRMRHLQTVYELQLEREISARREHELVVEKDLRDTVRAETSDSILALRHEIAALREQLGALGVTLPEDRFAVGGNAPAGQLGSGSSLPNVPSERVEPRRRAPGAAPAAGAAAGAGVAAASAAAASTAAGRPARTGESSTSRDEQKASASGSVTGAAAKPGADTAAGSGAGARPGRPRTQPTASGVAPDATPSTERTEKLSPLSDEPRRPAEPTRAPRRPAVRPATRPQADRPARPASTQQPTSTQQPAAKTEQQAAAKTESAPASEPAEKAADTPAAKSAQTSRKPADHTPTHAAGPRTSETPAAESPARAAGASAPAGEDAPLQSRHGEGTGLSVADLMARLGGGDESGGGRRRRRSAD